MKTKKLLLFVIPIITFSSCATLLSGTKDKVVINSIPPNADVFIDGEPVGKAGNEILLKRKYVNYRQVNLRKDGYEDLNFKIDQKIDPVYFLNFFTAGFTFLVDIASGAALMPKNSEFTRTLNPKEKNNK